MKEEEEVKLVFKRVAGRDSFALYTEDGKCLAGQSKTELISESGEIPLIRVTFGALPAFGVSVKGD